MEALHTAAPEVRAGLDWVAIVGGAEGLALPDGPKRFMAFEDHLLENGPDPEGVSTYRDVHSVMYTSGTTGPSKGVLISNGQFFSSASVFLDRKSTRLNSSH